MQFRKECYFSGINGGGRGGGCVAYQAKHNLTQSLQPKRFTNSFVNIFDETKEINGLEKEIKILFYIEKYKKYLIP